MDILSRAIFRLSNVEFNSIDILNHVQVTN